jgi:hypothetical protein
MGWWYGVSRKKAVDPVCVPVHVWGDDCAITDWNKTNTDAATLSFLLFPEVQDRVGNTDDDRDQK